MNYWENETPVKATTRRNEIEYYPTRENRYT